MCASSFVYPFPSNDELRAFYTGPAYVNALHLTQQSAANLEMVLAQERSYPNAVLDAERIAKTAKALSTGNTFLDVGSGYGFFSRAARSEGFDVDGHDAGRVPSHDLSREAPNAQTHGVRGSRGGAVIRCLGRRPARATAPRKVRSRAPAPRGGPRIHVIEGIGAAIWIGSGALAGEFAIPLLDFLTRTALDALVGQQGRDLALDDLGAREDLLPLRYVKHSWYQCIGRFSAHYLDRVLLSAASAFLVKWGEIDARR
jgi:hypothetical protein